MKPSPAAESSPAAAAAAFSPLPGRATPVPAATPAPQLPNPAEVKSAVARIFEKSAVPDHADVPLAVTGDFNGDGSEDLAVLIKPSADALADINSELANWILEDPHNVAILDAKTVRPAAPKPERAVNGEILLAVIHGAGAQGWRNSEARQTFVLKNTGGDGMKTESFAALQRGATRLPRLRGDAIKQTSGKSSGLIYWNGAKYSWYPTSK